MDTRIFGKSFKLISITQTALPPISNASAWAIRPIWIFYIVFIISVSISFDRDGDFSCTKTECKTKQRRWLLHDFERKPPLTTDSRIQSVLLFTILCHICSRCLCPPPFPPALSRSWNFKCKMNSFALSLCRSRYTSLCSIMNTGNLKIIGIYPFYEFIHTHWMCSYHSPCVTKSVPLANGYLFGFSFIILTLCIFE